MPICPNCQTKLRKEDVQRVLDYQLRGDDLVLVAKVIMCRICGYELLRKEVG